MSIINLQAAEDVRDALSGKDGVIYNGNGKLLAQIESFQVSENVSTVTYQPLGAFQDRAVPTSFKVTITLSEYVIEDNELISDLFEMNNEGTIPDWNLQGVVRGRNGSEERMVFPHVVPDGSIDLQNVTIGDLIKRNWNLTVNGAPHLQGRLSH
jgi:hypothetical protein